MEERISGIIKLHSSGIPSFQYSVFPLFIHHNKEQIHRGAAEGPSV
jgi:hypothetical protein